MKLEFYYYKGNSEEEARKNEREVMRKKGSKSFNQYGLTLRNEHGENIINKMMLEQRLTIIRSPEEE